MRLFFGIILGIILTVGGAYIADSMTPGEATTQSRMVNWPVVQTRFGDVGTNIKGMWNRLTGAPATNTTTTPASDKPATNDAPRQSN